MVVVRAFLTVVALAPMVGVVSAQPIDPYQQPSPTRAPAPNAPPPPAPTAPAPSAPAPSAPSSPPPALPGTDVPRDPYANPNAPPAAPDPAMAERVAQALVTR